MSRSRPRLKLHHLLLAVNLLALWLPLLGLEALRLYDSALVRQTESELIAQAAFVAASYRAALARLAPHALADPQYGQPLDSPWRERHGGEARWRPRPATLDLTEDRVRPPPAETLAAADPADPAAQAVGQELQTLLVDAQVTTLAGIAIADSRGVVVATTGPSQGRSLLGFEEVRRALAGEPVSLLRQRIPDSPPPAIDSISRGTLLRVFVAAPIVHEQRILAVALLWRTPAALSNVLYGKRYHLLAAAGLLLATVVLMSALTSITVVRPLRRLVQQAQRATAGEQGAMTPLARPVTREIADLSQAVATMADHLEQRASYIRTFAAQVSHEFKTPLAAMRGALELLRDHFDGMTAAERTRFLSHLDQDAIRLERLVRRLLELARAEALPMASAGRTDIAAVVRRLADRHRAAGLAVTVVEPLPAVTVAMAGESLESILTNLLDNARQHGGAAVTVTISAQETGKVDGERSAAVWLEISDDGPGISTANATRAFEPFFTTARIQGGTGLGLAIVKALLTAHGGAIELLASPAGTRLRLRLPGATG